ncbi:hypothetical protein PO909_019141 [Leuciscus waleckii]
MAVCWAIPAHLIRAALVNLRVMTESKIPMKKAARPCVRKRRTCLSYYCRKAICQIWAVLAWQIPLEDYFGRLPGLLIVVIQFYEGECHARFICGRSQKMATTARLLPSIKPQMALQTLPQFIFQGALRDHHLENNKSEKEGESRGL